MWDFFLFSPSLSRSIWDNFQGLLFFFFFSYFLNLTMGYRIWTQILKKIFWLIGMSWCQFDRSWFVVSGKRTMLHF
jgi:hypothetical protein